MKEIKRLVSEIAKIQNKPTSYNEAIEMNLSHYYDVEYSSQYGGYRIINVAVKNRSHQGTFEESSTVNRRTKNKMIDFLNGILVGLEYNQKTNIS